MMPSGGRSSLLALKAIAALLAALALQTFYRVAGDHDVAIPIPERERFFSLARIDPKYNHYSAVFQIRVAEPGDYRPVFHAAQGRLLDPAHRMYHSEELTRGMTSFVYTPWTAMMIAPLARPGVSLEASANLVSAINHLLWVLIGIMLYQIMVYPGRGSPAFAVMSVACFVAYYPLADALWFVQATIWISFFLTASAWLVRHDRFAAAGAALALGVSIKPHLAVVPLILLASPRVPRRLPVICLTTVCLTSLLALAWGGPANTRDYLFRTLPTLSAGYALHANQTLQAMLLRLGSYADPSIFNLAPPVTWIRVVSGLCGLAMFGLIAIAIRHEPTGRDDAPLRILAAAVGVAAIAAPVCWEHHLSVLLIAVAALVGHYRLRPELRTRGREGAMIAGFVLTGAHFDTRQMWGFPWALFSVPGLVGALLILGCLVGTFRTPPVGEGPSCTEHEA